METTHVILGNNICNGSCNILETTNVMAAAIYMKTTYGIVAAIYLETTNVMVAAIYMETTLFITTNANKRLTAIYNNKC